MHQLGIDFTIGADVNTRSMNELNVHYAHGSKRCITTEIFSRSSANDSLTH